jgi:hypothetical protein
MVGHLAAKFADQELIITGYLWCRKEMAVLSNLRGTVQDARRLERAQYE